MSSDETRELALEESADDGSFLRRWSERKLQAKAPPPIVEPVVESPLGQLTDADMPAIESLSEEADYSLFFFPKVSDTLRRQALHKLFHSPRFNVLDGLDDYQDDYTQFAALGSVVTQEMRHRLEIEAKRLARSITDPATSRVDVDDTAASPTAVACTEPTQGMPSPMQKT